MKNAISLLAILVVLAGVASPQAGVATKSIQQSPATAALLRNQDLVELQQAKLTAEELIAKIKSSKCEFDVSPSALETLKSAGLPETVIATVLQVTEPGSEPASSAPLETTRQITIPAGTKMDIEAAYTVSSFDVHPGELLSFRVLVPVKVDGADVIEKGALVTARVVEASRGRHWGKAGHLAWTMVDVVAADGTRIPVQIEGAPATSQGRTSVKGTSHGGEVATRTILMGVLLAPVFPIAPLALTSGFKRGDNAILPEGKRLVVLVQSEATVTAKVPAPR
jgi:hypothetical protein